MNKWTVQTFKDENGDLAIQLPEELMNQVGWSIGTEIEWIDNKDGSWTLKKVEDKK